MVGDIIFAGMVKREFANNAILIVGLNIIVKSFYLFGVDRTVQNTLPEGEYGLFFTFFNFAMLFQILADFGLQNYNARQLAQSRQLLQKYFPHLLSLKLILGLLFIVSVGLIGYAWGFRESHIWWLLIIVAGNQFLQTLVLFLRSNLAGLGRYRLDSWMSILDRLLLIIIAGALLWLPTFAPDFSLLRFVLAQTVAYTLAIIILLAVLLPR
ncbi:MAG: oligosaccharide flippase family protein, partial [Bacteroidota bacterium]